MLDTLKTLCYLSGVSGAEDEVRDYILERVMPYADSLSTDPMGNLIVFKKGVAQPAQRLLLCAHMDEVGLMVTGFMSEGYLRFSCVGGIDRRVLIGKKVYVGSQRILGVIGIKAYHLVEKSEETKTPLINDMYIDIGCATKEEAEELITIGDCCVFDDTVVEFGSGYLKAKAIDDRLGCAVMIKLIESDLPCDTWFAFTAQEEVGTRGAEAMAYSVSPDIALVLEGTTATDLPDIAENKHICSAGDGVVIPFMDGGTIYDKGIYSLLTSLADKSNIKWQTKQRVAGGTDGRAIQRSRGGVRAGGIACALRNIHSHASVGKISEFEDMLALTVEFLKYFAENGIN